MMGYAIEKSSKNPKKRSRAAGEGTIYQRPDGLWEGRVTIGYDSNGKRKRKSVYGKKQADVVKKLNELKSQLNTQQVKAEPGNISVEQFLTNWLGAQAGLATTTHNLYEGTIRNHILPYLGHFRLKDISILHINDMFNKLELKLRYQENAYRPRGQRTLSLVSFLLSRAFTIASNEYGIKNPTKSNLVRKYSQKHLEAEYMNEEEVAALLKAAKGERLEWFFHIALLTGLRPGELFGLAWSDVNLKKRTLTVRRSVNETNGRLNLSDAKNFTSRRTIKISPAACRAFEMQRNLQLTETNKLCPGNCKPSWFHDYSWIFKSTNGHPLRRGNVCGKDRVLGRILKRANLNPHITLHTMRHTHASILLQHYPLPLVSRRLGHRNEKVTIQYYWHLLPGHDDQAADAIDHLIPVDSNEGLNEIEDYLYSGEPND